MIQKKIHRKHEEHEPYTEPGVNSGTTERYAVLAPLVAPYMGLKFRNFTYWKVYKMLYFAFSFDVFLFFILILLRP